MKINKTLRPLALALPGLVAAYAHAGWTTITERDSGSPWYADGVVASGYTDAYYSGPNINPIYRINEGNDRVLGWVGLTQEMWSNVTYLQASATWSWNTYSDGESNVNNSGDVLRPTQYLPGGLLQAADSDLTGSGP